MPRKAKSEYLESVTSRIPKQTRAWLKKRAKTEKVTLSEYIQNVLVDHVGKQSQEAQV